MIGTRPFGPGRRTRRVVGAAVLVAAATAGCTGTGAGGTDQPAGPTTPPLSRPEAARLAADLMSADPAVRRDALAAGVREGARDDVPLVPPGSTLSIDETRAVPGTDLAAGTAEVPATVAGPRPGSWILLLVRDGDRWTVYGSRPA